MLVSDAQRNAHLGSAPPSRYAGLLRVNAFIFDEDLARIIIAHSPCKGERATLIRKALKYYFDAKAKGLTRD